MRKKKRTERQNKFNKNIVNNLLPITNITNANCMNKL